jgi:hypothetical protein
MRSFGLSDASVPAGEIDAVVAPLGTFVERMQVLDAWSHEVVRPNLAQTELGDGEAPVALPRYLAAVAGVDCAERFTTMLRWIGDQGRRVLASRLRRYAG